ICFFLCFAISILFFFLMIRRPATSIPFSLHDALPILLTRRITRAVADLYKATQFVKTGDLSHRIPVERPDQLGVLAESFNDMTRSEEHTSELQSPYDLVCRLLLENKKS